MNGITGGWETRIEAEFRQCPGLRLSRVQAQRLWGIPAAELNAVLELLLARGVLRKSSNDMLTLNRGGCQG